jgi:hypothetical protein
MLCESGPLNLREFLDGWGVWYGPYFRFIEGQDVRAIMYWPGKPDEPAPQPGGFGGGSLHRLSPALRDMFVREVRKPSFLQGDARLFDSISFKP